MGVPKFFRYISERYPCLSELVRENQVGGKFALQTTQILLSSNVTLYIITKKIESHASKMLYLLKSRVIEAQL